MGVELFFTVRVLVREPVTTTASSVDAATLAVAAVAAGSASASAAWVGDAARIAVIRTVRVLRTGAWAAGMGLVGWAGNTLPFKGLFTHRDRRDRVTQPSYPASHMTAGNEVRQPQRCAAACRAEPTLGCSSRRRQMHPLPVLSRAWPRLYKRRAAPYAGRHHLMPAHHSAPCICTRSIKPCPAHPPTPLRRSLPSSPATARAVRIRLCGGPVRADKTRARRGRYRTQLCAGEPVRCACLAERRCSFPTTSAQLMTPTSSSFPVGASQRAPATAAA